MRPACETSRCASTSAGICYANVEPAARQDSTQASAGYGLPRPSRATSNDDGVSRLAGVAGRRVGVDARHRCSRGSQIVGKVRLARAPTMWRWWNGARYVAARGLTTSMIPVDCRASPPTKKRWPQCRDSEERFRASVEHIHEALSVFTRSATTRAASSTSDGSTPMRGRAPSLGTPRKNFRADDCSTCCLTTAPAGCSRCWRSSAGTTAIAPGAVELVGLRGTRRGGLGPLPRGRCGTGAGRRSRHLAQRRQGSAGRRDRRPVSGCHLAGLRGRSPRRLGRNRGPPGGRRAPRRARHHR